MRHCRRMCDCCVYLERSGTDAKQSDCLVVPQRMINLVRMHSEAISRSLLVRLEFNNHMLTSLLEDAIGTYFKRGPYESETKMFPCVPKWPTSIFFGGHLHVHVNQCPVVGPMMICLLAMLYNLAPRPSSSSVHALGHFQYANTKV